MNDREERKNNGQGIFYAVIGVATLVVTIIGATFAFFTATANSANNAITAAGATVSLTLTEANPNGLKGNLIPVDERLAKFASVIGIGDTKCKDDLGNNICSVYEFTVTNPSSNTASQTIYPTFKAVTNGFTNLKYAVFMGPASSIPTSANLRETTDSQSPATPEPASSDYTDVSGTRASNGALIIPNTTAPAANASHTATGTSTTSDTLDNMRITLGSGQSVTYTIVMWIHETNFQQNAEQGAQFAAGITFNTSWTG